MTKSIQNRSETMTEKLEEQISAALELLVQLAGLVNGTITIHARGGQLCRGIEIVNKVDVRALK